MLLRGVRVEYTRKDVRGFNWCIFVLLSHGPGKVGRGTWQQGPALSYLCTRIPGQSAHKLFVGILRQQENMKLPKSSKFQKFQNMKFQKYILSFICRT